MSVNKVIIDTDNGFLLKKMSLEFSYEIHSNHGSWIIVTGHCLIPCWPIIIQAPWHSTEGKFTQNTHPNISHQDDCPDVTGDVEGCLQHLQWWSGKSLWWPFCFCGWFVGHQTLKIKLKHNLNENNVFVLWNIWNALSCKQICLLKHRLC